MKVTPLEIPGPCLIELEPRGDNRGWFARSYCADEFATAGLVTDWPQMNLSFNARKGTVRGLHFQRPPAAEVKIVRCIAGAIYDVAVDLRDGSTTYGQHIHVELSSENRRALYIPAGFAHGYQTLTDDVEMLYMHSAPYSPDHEGGLAFTDNNVAINWPLPLQEISDRDRTHPILADLEPIKL
ncbi:dTDP-4-dehydrorhamnose 3,5-epimerase [Pseudooceanicola sp. MF1-13]|uniref:dTDP-4-dehydrorhamnose 3,5-epimerase n=1 Tax=Pseudooceanicola sp. MF1-13 TaxID=3379095 RepID=UPI003892AB8B